MTYTSHTHFMEVLFYNLRRILHVGVHLAEHQSPYWTKRETELHFAPARLAVPPGMKKSHREQNVLREHLSTGLVSDSLPSDPMIEVSKGA